MAREREVTEQLKWSCVQAYGGLDAPPPVPSLGDLNSIAGLRAFCAHLKLP